MAKPKSVRVYDYVNHSYDTVREKLASGGTELFRDATKTAAAKAKSIASELHVNFAGIEISTDISIRLTSIDESPKTASSGPVTRFELEWEAAQMPRLFPFMKAVLSVYPLTATETQLDFFGNYEPPLGVIGSAMDAVVGHRIAEASVHQFITEVAAHLRGELKE